MIHALTSCPCGGWSGDLSPWLFETNFFLQVQETRKRIIYMYIDIMALVTYAGMSAHSKFVTVRLNSMPVR